MTELTLQGERLAASSVTTLSGRRLANIVLYLIHNSFSYGYLLAHLESTIL